MATTNAKVVFLGASGVGKTCLSIRMTKDSFNEDTVSTVGAFFLTKTVFVDGSKLVMQLWDTAGQERFRSMAPMFYRGADCALLVLDVTERDSLEAAKSWVDELRSKQSQVIDIILVANKVDLDNRQIPCKDIESFAKQIGSPFFEVSAKSGEGIDRLQQTVVSSVMKLPREKSLKEKSIDITELSPRNHSRGCC